MTTSLRLSSRSAGGIAALLGSTSLFVLAGLTAAHAQAAAGTNVEEVLITGSLIRGTQAVGVPVTALSTENFQETGAVTVSDLLRNVPSVVVDASVGSGASPGNWERLQKVDLRGLSTGAGVRTLMLVDGMRYPVQGHGTCSNDPSIIPSSALDHIDLLVDGASATYGSDAIAGVVNVITKQRYDGATTQVRYQQPRGPGGQTYQVDQNWGKTWDGGDIALAYEWYDSKALPRSSRDYFTYDFTPWGLDNRTPLRSAVPGIVSTGALSPSSASTGTGCLNCYSIPAGSGWDYGDTAAHTNPTAPGSAPTTTWTALLANKGTGNEINPYRYADESAAQQRNAATVNFDQRLMPGVEFFASGFYSNRRAEFRYSGTHNRPLNDAINNVVVPTTNPYYPAGAPVGLRINYLISAEIQPYSTGFSRGGRYAGGFNIDLPEDWKAKLFYQTSEDANFAATRGVVNLNNFNAALGNTVASVAANGNIPGQAAFTKPANIPYLNVFCDATAYKCNSLATLDYMTGQEVFDEKWIIHEWGANFDGPLFALPAGEVKAAIGADYVSNAYRFTDTQNINTASLALPATTPSVDRRNVWAIFGQLNAPLVGDANALPLVKKLDLEFSWRLDHYDDFGGTKNPKVALDWGIVDGLTLRGSWGTSFRAPAFSETSAVAGRLIMPVNAATGAAGNNVPVCPAGASAPVAGSAGAELIAAGLANCTGTPLQMFPGGISIGGGSDGLAGVTRPIGSTLGPEKAKSYSAGFEFAPTFLPGLELNATYFWTLIKGTIAGGSTDLTDPLSRSNILIQGDPGFDDAVVAILNNPLSTVSPTQASNIKFIQDSSAKNLGSLNVTGLDFFAGYTFDTDGMGTWTTDVTGTYYIRRKNVGAPGQAPVDTYDSSDSRPGETRGPRFRYRARLSWDNGDGLSITGILNYRSHFFNSQAFPSAAVLAAAGFTNYSNLVPATYFIDLSVGYDLRDKPENDYLKNLRFQFVVNNIADRDPSFVYRIATNGGTFAQDETTSPFGRTFSLTITKNW